MPPDETQDRQPEKPPSDHHFETPVVREAPIADAVAGSPPDPDPDADPDREGDVAEPRRTQEREMAFQYRWEKVQAVFVARGRRGLRPV
jgi:hypothetical protein